MMFLAFTVNNWDIILKAFLTLGNAMLLPGALGCPVRVGRDGGDAEHEDDAEGLHSEAVWKNQTLANGCKDFFN